eukprot:9741-Chlamydomonas_euryale.AAC.3
MLGAAAAGKLLGGGAAAASGLLGGAAADGGMLGGAAADGGLLGPAVYASQGADANMSLQLTSCIRLEC